MMRKTKRQQQKQWWCNKLSLVLWADRQTDMLVAIQPNVGEAGFNSVMRRCMLAYF